MKYRVIGYVTISVSVVVEAKDEKEARKLAAQSGMQSLCRQCAYGEDDAWSTSGELDGEVTIDTVEEA